MRTRTFVIGLVTFAAIAAPLSASALTAQEVQSQIDALMSQIKALSTQLKAASSATTRTDLSKRHRVCDALARALSQNAVGDDVHALQEFLADQGYLRTSPTGFFGKQTFDALRRWQKANGIASEIDPAGWGFAGPQTRAFILKWCSDSTASTTPVSTSAAPGVTMNPVTVVISTTASGNRPPLIALSGPTTLLVNQTGAWTLSASDPENQPLSYRVSWGDGGSALDSLTEAAGSVVIASSTSLTHAYATEGRRAITVRVSDGQSRETQTVAVVNVRSSERPGTSSCTTDQYRCTDGQVVSRSGPYCQFACAPVTAESGGLLCTHGGQVYKENQAYVANSCEGDAQNLEEARCAPVTFACKSGKWQRKTSFTCAYDTQTYAEGTRHPLGVPGADMGDVFCVRGEWIAENPSTSCVYGGASYAYGTYAPCAGFITGSSCTQPEERFTWRYRNICRSGSWQLEVI